MITRYSLGLAIALLAFGASRAPAQTGDAALDEAIRLYDPAMSLSEDSSLVHAADFNGDGRRDVAAVLVGGGKSALVIFNGTRSGYQAHALYASLPAGPWRLNVLAPDRYRILGPEGAVEIAWPAIELVFPGRASAMYAWRGNRYQVYGTENYR